MRPLVPEQRRRAYDVRKVIHVLADNDSVLELRREFGIGIITALIRIEGHRVHSRMFKLVKNSQKLLSKGGKLA